jgi:hypothetical protein
MKKENVKQLLREVDWWFVLRGALHDLWKSRVMWFCAGMYATAKCMIWVIP